MVDDEDDKDDGDDDDEDEDEDDRVETASSVTSAVPPLPAMVSRRCAETSPCWGSEQGRAWEPQGKAVERAAGAPAKAVIKSVDPQGTAVEEQWNNKGKRWKAVTSVQE